MIKLKVDLILLSFVGFILVFLLYLKLAGKIKYIIKRKLKC